MRKLSAFYEDGKLTLQKKDYIEDGWYIEQNGNYWKLFEIPQYGGQPEEIGNYGSLGTALERADELT